MSDNLRDRIAKVLWKQFEAVDDNAVRWDELPDFRDLADAVIAELGLRRESRPNDYDHRNYPDGDRYITKWIGADDE